MTVYNRNLYLRKLIIRHPMNPFNPIIQPAGAMYFIKQEFKDYKDFLIFLRFSVRFLRDFWAQVIP